MPAKLVAKDLSELPQLFKLKQQFASHADTANTKEQLMHATPHTTQNTAIRTPHHKSILDTLLCDAETLDVCIFKVMQNHAGYTIPELTELLAGYASSPEMIQSTAMALYNKGFFCVTARGVYTLKQGKTLMDLQIKSSGPRVHRMVDTTPVIDPKGVIKLSEGVDISIWKALADYKARTCVEVAEILEVFGFDRAEIKGRLVTLYKRHWLDRHTRHQAVYYTLKKHIPMPEPELKLYKKYIPDMDKPIDPEEIPSIQETMMPEPTTSLLPVAAAILPDDPIIVKIWKLMSDYLPHSSADITSHPSLSDSTKANLQKRISRLTNDGWFTRSAGGDRGSYYYTLRADVPMPVDRSRIGLNAGAANVKPIPAHPIPQAGMVQTFNPAFDGMMLTIWKVLCDYKSYTSQEVVLLLREYGVNAQTVFAALSRMASLGWVTREREPSKSGTAYRYTLKTTTQPPRPTQGSHSRKLTDDVKPQGDDAVKAVLSRSLAEVFETAMHNPLSVEESAKIDAAAKALLATPAYVAKMAAHFAGRPAEKVTNTAAAEAVAWPLLDTQIRIKGKVISDEDAYHLTAELKLLGYGIGRDRSAVVMVKSTIEILGLQFTPEELEALAQGLIKAGLVKKT